MSSLYFQLISIFYVMLLIVVYFSKKRLKTFENQLYIALVITNFVGLILDIITTYMAIIDVQNAFLNILCKFFILYLLTWLFIFIFYIYTISTSNKKKRENDKEGNADYKNRIPMSYTFLYIIFFILILIVPLYNFSENGIVYTHGPGADTIIYLSAAGIVIMLFFVLKNIKHIDYKKYLPLFVFIVVIAFTAAIQAFYPQVLLISSALSFVTFLMYFTIENPDLQMINELNIARDQAEKANSAKTDFLSSMSHEIRTPLNAIVGFSQSLSEGDISDSAREEVKYILSASESLLDIVNGILDISKIEANKLEIINTEYNIRKVLDELVSLAKGRLGDKSLDFRVNFDQSIPPFLYGDYIRLKQIIINLLTNSIKYTKEGYIEFKVCSIVKGNICRLIISVEDSGIGIKKEKIDKLFEKFERADVEKNNSIEGTGLGLAITKKLIDLMSGQIVVQSEYGEGSNFTVAIDQRIVTEVSNKMIQNAVSEDEKVINATGKRVLVVDDNKINLKVATRLLANYNVEVEEVLSGQECIDKITSGEKYDLIFMDDMMPKMSGVETFKELKKIPGFEIPTIALTANAISGMKEKYIKQGFDGYLPKPIERTELSRIIKNFLSKN